MDLVRVETQKECLYSFLSVGWGLMADIDIESERFRALGDARFTVWAVIRAIGNFVFLICISDSEYILLRSSLFIGVKMCNAQKLYLKR